MKEYFKNRRSVRKYRGQGVPRELIVNLLQLASQAPNTGNMQLYSVIITEEPSNIKKLAECHFNQPASVNAKAIVTFCVDYNRFEKWCRINNAKPGFENFQSFIAGAIDATILCQQFNTLAELEGLGCCYLGTTTYNAREISEVLNLPSRVVPICSLSLGWPESDSAPTERLDSESFIHLEKYDDYNEEDIEMLYIILQFVIKMEKELNKT